MLTEALLYNLLNLRGFQAMLKNGANFHFQCDCFAREIFLFLLLTWLYY